MAPDHRPVDAALDLRVLRPQADAAKRIDVILPPEAGVAVDDDVRMQPALLTDFHMFTDDAIRSDRTTGADLRRPVNDRRGMDQFRFLFGGHKL